MVKPHQVKGSRAAKIHMAKVRAIKASGGSLASNWVAKLAAHKKTGQQNWKGRTPHGVFDISRVRNPSKHLRDNYGQEEDTQHDEHHQMSDHADSDTEARQTYFGQPLSRRELLNIRLHGLNKNLRALHAEGKRLRVVDPDQVYDDEVHNFQFPPHVTPTFRSRAQKEWLKRFRAADAVNTELARIKDLLDEEEQRDHISDREEPEQNFYEDEQQQEADHHNMHDYNSDDERGGPTRAARRPAREARARRPRATAQVTDHHDMHDYNSDDEMGGPTRAARRPAREQELMSDARYNSYIKEAKSAFAEGKRLGLLPSASVYPDFYFTEGATFTTKAKKQWLVKFRKLEALSAELQQIRDSIQQEEQQSEHASNSEVRGRRPLGLRATARAARLNAVVVRAPAERRRRRSEEAPAVKLTKAQAKARHHAAAVTLADKVRRQVRL